MKRSDFVLLMAMFVSITVSLAGVVKVVQELDKKQAQKEDVVVGQTYITKFTPENPFLEPRIDTVIVLDVKKGYVKYRLHTDTGSFLSTRVKYFLEDIR